MSATTRCVLYHHVTCSLSLQYNVPPHTNDQKAYKLFNAVAPPAVHNFTNVLCLRHTHHDPSSSGARKTVFLHWPDGHESIYHTVSHQGPGCLMPGHNVLQYLHAHNSVAEGLLLVQHAQLWTASHTASASSSMRTKAADMSHFCVFKRGAAVQHYNNSCVQVT